MRVLKRMAFALVAIFALAACSTDKYETVAGDPLGTKIYTLQNGLKVYMSVNKQEPRIQTYIAVRNGGKNDPSDNTGLAHYLEHLMFKGTPSLGTTDYEAEKVILDQIEELYEVYRTKTDEEERRALYHVIDSLSFEASKISIPNEYDKAMSIIGSTGSNASTSEDVTNYTENIPSNQIENWAKIQSDRFKNMVIRGFHTELETVYEEYNMYMNEDGENAMYAMDSVLFKNHPYGTQSVIGTSDHLKNPSIKAIKHQKETMYVPNNCAICLSGDFDPDEMVAIIEKYFGDWQPNPEVPELKYEPEEEIKAPVTRHVYGTQAEFVMIGWRIPGQNTQESEIGSIASSVLSNGMAGLIDLDINQQQKTLSAAASAQIRVDYGEFDLEGSPKQGQSLEEVRDLLLAEMAKLRAGDFNEDLIAAAVANQKLRQMRSLENNSSRARQYVSSFIAKHNWADDVHKMDRLEKITKDDVVAWANKYLGENSYCVVFKHLGANPKNQKIVAPAITPIATNRDKQSAFLTEIQNTEVQPIEPVFVNYDTDLAKFDAKEGMEVLYKKNEINDIATMNFIFDEGLLNDPALSMATDYISYLGTKTNSAEKMALEMYKLACNFSFRTATNTLQLSVSGLNENIGKAMDLVEDLISNAAADEKVLESYKLSLLKSRADNKFNQNACTNALNNYVMYGPEYVKNTTMTDEQIMNITSEELLGKVKELLTKQHTVAYYGPASEAEVKTLLAEHHKVADKLEPLTKLYPAKVLTAEPKVFIAPYKTRQFNYIQFTCDGAKYAPEDDAVVRLYNMYFGSGMNAIVFQEMREARALAYRARASLNVPTFKDDAYSFQATIGSQSDKLHIAVEAFDDIINNMPESQKAFDIAKTSIDATLRTQRTTGMQVINNYLNDRELGRTEPNAKYIYETAKNLTMQDVVAAQQKYVKNRTYYFGLLGDRNLLDLKYLSTMGPVQHLTLEDIFGY